MSAIDLSGVRAKIERAKQHIRDLDARIDSFRESRSYITFADKQSEEGESRLHLTIKPRLPVEFGLIAGDAVHNLRSALDHTACQLGVAGGDTSYRQAFSIFESRAKYETLPRKE